MDKLSFVIWLIMFPVASSVSTYLMIECRRKSDELENINSDDMLLSCVIEIVAYIWIAILLWKN